LTTVSWTSVVTIVRVQVHFRRLPRPLQLGVPSLVLLELLLLLVVLSPL
jgi:hypothetical protein